MKDSLCSQLADAWKRGAQANGATVHHFDATELDFDLVLRGRHVNAKTDEPGLARVRAAVEASRTSRGSSPPGGSVPRRR